MDVKYYEEELKKLEEKYKAEKITLAKAFALANNNVNIGDLVSDHTSTIKADRISFYIGFSRVPECVYHGPRYTKSGKPFKSGERGTVYQSNMR